MPSKIIQIVTGTYTYTDNYNGKGTGHCIYGLDIDGRIWKWIPSRRKWLALEDAAPDVMPKHNHNNER